MAAKRYHATLQEQIAIRDKLTEILSKNEDGTFTYQSGWDDAVLAKHISSGTALNASHVQSVRQQLFGHVRRPPTVGTADRVDTLEQHMADVRKLLDNTIGALDLLTRRVDALSRFKLSHVEEAKPSATPIRGGSR